MTLHEAFSYAIGLREDCNVMLDKKNNEYHVIRLFGVEHWLQHYKNIAEVRVKMDVRIL